MRFFNTMFSQTSSQSYLIIGLGNPGRDYRNNRHNIGFMLMDRLAERLSIEFTRIQHKALFTDGRYKGTRILLAKPQTYMNNSGQSVGALMRFFKIPASNLLVAYDDVDLPFATLRMRASGGSAGQKGMKSVIQHLKTEEFPRLRLGIDRPPGRMSTPDYVLQDFSSDIAEELAIFLDRAADAALKFTSEGLDAAMTQYNRSES